MSAPSGDNSPLVVVHYWVAGDRETLLYPQELLKRGVQLVDAFSDTETWYQPLPYDHNVFSRTCHAFTYSARAPAPPLSLSSPQSYERTIQEWEMCPVAGGEVAFSLDELEEFHSSDFILTSAHHLGPFPNIAHPHVPDVGDGSHKHSLYEAADRQNTIMQAKRRHIPPLSLAGILPEPHFIASPTAITPLSPSHVGPNTWFKGTSPRIIPPKTPESVQELLDDPYARAAWIVPVCGVPPWNDCTPASIIWPVAADQSLPLPSSAALGAGIIWTHDSLKAFWDFLLSVRHAGTLGLLSLSFHAAPTLGLDVKRSRYQADGPGDSTTSSAERNSDHDTQRSLSQSLLSVDHIKIYHDTRYTKQARNVLNAWRYIYRQTAEGRVSSGKHTNHVARQDEAVDLLTDQSTIPANAATHPIRLCKGARLVLLDERSRPVLTC